MLEGGHFSIHPKAFPSLFSAEESGIYTRQRLQKRAMTTTTATNESVVVKTLARNHFCLDQNLNPRVVQTIAKSLPWYGPKFSPHDVPNFYDVSGITENPEAFKLVVDTFAERYESMKEKTDENCRIRRQRVFVRTDDCDAIR